MLNIHCNWSVHYEFVLVQKALPMQKQCVLVLTFSVAILDWKTKDTGWNGIHWE